MSGWNSGPCRRTVGVRERRGEVARELPLDAENELVGRRRLQAGRERVDGRRGAGVFRVHVHRRDEPADVDLRRVDPAVPVGVIPVVVKQRDPGKGVDGRHVGPELVGEPGVRGPQQRAPVAAERPCDADSRLDRPPRDRIAGVAAVAHRGQQLGESGVRGSARGQVPGLLVVEPGAEVHGEVGEPNRVGEVRVVEVVFELDVLGPGHLGLGGLLKGEAHERVSGPGRRRFDVRVPVSEAELELVLQRSRVEEGRRRDAGIVLRPLVELGDVTVLPDVVHVRVRLLGEAAFGGRVPVNRDGREIERRKELLRQDLRVLQLVGRARPVDVLGRRLRALRTGATAVDAALEVEVGERQRVRRRGLCGELRVEVPVRLLAAHRLAARQEERLAKIGVCGRRAPDPDPILPDGSPDLDAVVPLRAVGVQGSRGAGDQVRTALGHEVDGHAGARERRVRAAGQHADGLERIEVEEHGRQAVDRDARALDAERVLVCG